MLSCEIVSVFLCKLGLESQDLLSGRTSVNRKFFCPKRKKRGRSQRRTITPNTIHIWWWW